MSEQLKTVGEQGEVGYIPLDRIHINTELKKNLLRKSKDGDKSKGNQFDELVDSIRTHGLMKPIHVTPLSDMPGFYGLVTGLQRFSAFKRLGKASIPAIIKNKPEDDDQYLFQQLSENMTRVDTTIREFITAVLTILARNPQMTLADIAKGIGKSASFVSQRLKLKKLPETVLEQVNAGDIKVQNGYYLSGLVDLDLPQETWDHAVLQASVLPSEKFAVYAQQVKETIQKLRREGANTDTVIIPTLRKKAEIEIEWRRWRAHVEGIEATVKKDDFKNEKLYEKALKDAVGGARDFLRALEWALQVDEESVARRRQEMEEKKAAADAKKKAKEDAKVPSEETAARMAAV